MLYYCYEYRVFLTCVCVCGLCWIESVGSCMLECIRWLYGSGCKCCWCKRFIIVMNMGCSLRMNVFYCIISVGSCMLACIWWLYGSACKWCWFKWFITVLKFGCSLALCILLNPIGLVCIWLSHGSVCRWLWCKCFTIIMNVGCSLLFYGFCWIILVGSCMLDCIRWLYGSGCKWCYVYDLLLLWIWGVPYLCILLNRIESNRINRTGCTIHVGLYMVAVWISV